MLFTGNKDLELLKFSDELITKSCDASVNSSFQLQLDYIRLLCRPPQKNWHLVHHNNEHQIIHITKVLILCTRYWFYRKYNRFVSFNLIYNEG